jgi:proteasome maturation protein
VTLKDGAAASHPVEQIQKLGGAAGEAARLQMLTNVYGSALPARMQIERQILNRQGLVLLGME